MWDGNLFLTNLLCSSLKLSENQCGMETMKVNKGLEKRHG